MIDANILKALARTAPNYHLVSDGNARASTVCVCSRCSQAVHWKGKEWVCQPLLNRLERDEMPKGYAWVAANGTCDRAIDHQLKFDFSKAEADKHEASDAEYRMEADNAAEAH